MAVHACVYYAPPLALTRQRLTAQAQQLARQVLQQDQVVAVVLRHLARNHLKTGEVQAPTEGSQAGITSCFVAETLRTPQPQALWQFHSQPAQMI